MQRNHHTTKKKKKIIFFQLTLTCILLCSFFRCARARKGRGLSVLDRRHNIDLQVVTTVLAGEGDARAAARRQLQRRQPRLRGHAHHLPAEQQEQLHNSVRGQHRYVLGRLTGL